MNEGRNRGRTERWRNIDIIKGRKELVYLTTHSTHFIYGYMASDIWFTTTQIAKEGRPLLRQSWNTGWNGN